MFSNTVLNSFQVSKIATSVVFAGEGGVGGQGSGAGARECEQIQASAGLINYFQSTPLPLKKSRFFQTKCIIFCKSRKTYFLKTFVCIVIPSLSTGSNEIFRKNKDFFTPSISVRPAYSMNVIL